MINVTDKIHYLSDGKILDQGIRDALIYVSHKFDDEHGLYTGQPVKGHTNLGFQRFFPVTKVLTQEVFDTGYLNAVFSAVKTTAAERSPKDFEFLVVVKDQKISPNYMGNIKTGLSIALIHLWANRHILLPTTFVPNMHGKYKDYSRGLYTDGLAHFDALLDELGSRESAAPHVSNGLAFAIEHLVNRVFFASDWHSLGEVSIKDVIEFRNANAAAKKGVHSYKFGQAGYPLTFILEEVLYVTGDDACFNKYELDQYVNDGLVALSRSKKTRKYTSRSNVGVVSAKDSIDGDLAETVKILASSSNATNETILEYLMIQQFTRKKNDHPTSWYLGRESYVPEYASLWIRLVDEFIEYWGETNESVESKVKHFSRFFDYLFVYLPWWNQLYGGSIEMPSVPKKFKRALYVKRHNDEDIEILPLTYTDFLTELNPQKTSASNLSHCKHTLRQFFVWLSEEYEDDEEIAGKKFSIPVKTTDCKYRGQGRRKTNKVRITKKVYPFLLAYAYSVHAYLEWYQDACVNGMVSNPRKKKLIEIDFEDEVSGLCPIFYHNDLLYKIEKIPPLFSNYDSVIIKTPDGNSKRCALLPSLASLRMLLVMLDTGLRGAGVNWLDRTNYDQYVDPRSKMYTENLFVNTDKAKEEGFTTRVYKRVMDVIKAEVEFISNIDHPLLSIPQKYKNRKNSRFGEVFPVFCGVGSTSIGKVVSRVSWSEKWRDLLLGFQSWYELNLDVKLDMVVEESQYDNDDEPVLDKQGRHKTKMVVVHSPHAIRSTVVSERMSVMPVSVNAMLVGHKNDETNIYYYQPEEEEVDQMLALSDVMLAPVDIGIRFDNSLSNIKPSRTNSSLKRALGRSREIAANRFGFTSVSLTQTEHDLDGEVSHLETGVDIIADAPSSRLIVHDTHICPVGDSCPKDVLNEIKEPKRCGLCRIAVKTIDNIPAINAKKLALEENAKINRKKAIRMRQQGENEDVISHYYEQSDYDVMESVAWHLAEVVLLRKYTDLAASDDAGTVMHVDDPELLAKKIQRAEITTNESIKLLKRISDSNAYVNLQDENLRAKSRRLHRMMFGSDNEVSLFDMDDDDPVKSLCSRIATEIEHRKISVSEIVSRLETHRKDIDGRAMALENNQLHMIADSLVKEA